MSDSLAAISSLPFIAGDAVEIDLTIVDENNDPVDISLYTFAFGAKRPFGVNAMLSTGSNALVSIVDAAAGQLRISIDAADTADLLGNYVWQCSTTDQNGFVQTVARGFMTFDERFT